jgi:hypothetical protein
MTVLTNWNFSLSADDVMRGQGTDPDVIRTSRPRLLAAAKRAQSLGLGLIHPVSLTKEVTILTHHHGRILLEGGGVLTGPLVTRHLAGAQRVIAALCTIGPELEVAVTELLCEDPLYALALDGLGNAAVESLAQQVCTLIGEKVKAEGLQTSTPISPGNKEWSVDVGQPQIFSLLDSSQVGIRLSPNSMMHPKKSMSFIIGIGSEMSQANLCEVCSLKETCRYQHA